MLVPALILALLASAAQASTTTPVVVTGHAWAPFISPMGEPFRARTTSDDTLANWFRQADGNHDGILTPGEMQADAARFFATLDDDRNGVIEPEEIVHYEWEVAPEIQVNSRKRRAPGEAAAKVREDGAERGRRGRNAVLQGAARYALLNIPEPVAAADLNYDRGISLSEFREAAASRFHLLDPQKLGRLTLAQLQTLRSAPKPKDDKVDRRVGTPIPLGD